MGFSVSGSAAIVFAGMFVAFSIFYGAASNGFERVSEAESEQIDRSLEERNIDIEIVLADYDSDFDSGTGRLSIFVNNTGTKTLSINETDFIYNGSYQDSPSTAIIRDSGVNDTSTDLWQPGEQLRIRITGVSDPERAMVVTEHGVADAVDLSDSTTITF